MARGITVAVMAMRLMVATQMVRLREVIFLLGFFCLLWG